MALGMTYGLGASGQAVGASHSWTDTIHLGNPFTPTPQPGVAQDGDGHNLNVRFPTYQDWNLGASNPQERVWQGFNDLPGWRYGFDSDAPAREALRQYGLELLRQRDVFTNGTEPYNNYGNEALGGPDHGGHGMDPSPPYVSAPQHADEPVQGDHGVGGQQTGTGQGDATHNTDPDHGAGQASPLADPSHNTDQDNPVAVAPTFGPDPGSVQTATLEPPVTPDPGFQAPTFEPVATPDPGLSQAPTFEPVATPDLGLPSFGGASFAPGE
jgi:hypothetical protein